MEQNFLDLVLVLENQFWCNEMAWYKGSKCLIYSKVNTVAFFNHLQKFITTNCFTLDLKSS